MNQMNTKVFLIYDNGKDCQRCFVSNDKWIMVIDDFYGFLNGNNSYFVCKDDTDSSSFYHQNNSVVSSEILQQQ